MAVEVLRHNERYTPQEVADALHQAKGMKTIAARLLGCSRETVMRYVKRYSVCRQAVEDEREAMIDMAELALFRRIQQGDGWAIQFALRTIGRERGYQESLATEHKETKRVEFTLDLGRKLTAATDDTE